MMPQLQNSASSPPLSIPLEPLSASPVNRKLTSPYMALSTIQVSCRLPLSLTGSAPEGQISEMLLAACSGLK